MSHRFGEYDVIEAVAEGTTARVYRARHSELGRIAAIKELLPAVRERTEVLDRLRAEASALSRLSHRHIVALYDYVEEDDRAWLAEQWVDGATLEQILQAQHTLTPEQALGVVRGAVTGLAYAHSQGLVHRDVSTRNILADLEGTSMLVDFGLAAPAGAGAALGTPAFLSPEAARGEAVSPPGDVYSTAAVLYALLMGQPVFAGSATEVVRQHRESEPPALSGHGDALADLIRRSLDKDPARRPRDAGAFLVELEEAAERRYGAGWLGRASIAALVTASGAGVLASTGAQPGLETVVVDTARTVVPTIVKGTRKIGTKAGVAIAAGVVVAGLVTTGVVVTVVADDSPSSASLADAVELSEAEREAEESEEAEKAAEAEAEAEIIESVPTGKWRLESVLVRTNIPKLQQYVGQPDKLVTWKLEPSCDTAAACGGKISSSSGNTFRYEWDGNRLVVTRTTTRGVQEGECYRVLPDGTVTDEPVPGTHYKDTYTHSKQLIMRGREGSSFHGVSKSQLVVSELVDCEDDTPKPGNLVYQWTLRSAR